MKLVRNTLFGSVAQKAVAGAKLSGVAAFTLYAGIAVLNEANLLVNYPQKPHYVKHFGLFTVNENDPAYIHTQTALLLAGAVVVGVFSAMIGCLSGSVIGGVSYCISKEKGEDVLENRLAMK